MKRFLRILPLLAVIFGLFLFPARPLFSEASPRRADFGDFSGDSDFGDSGGWDSGGDSWDSGGWDSDSGGWDSDSGGSYSGGGNSDGGGACSILFSIIIIATFVSLLAYFSPSNKRSLEQMAQPSTPARKLRPVNEYLSVDPSFSEEQFRDKVSNLYVQFQNAWQKKDLSSLRPYLTDTYFAQMDNQLNRYRQNRQTNMVERIAVLSTNLLGWTQDAGFDEMVVRLETRIVDYVVDDATGNIVRGSRTAEKFMTYEWTLIRKNGVITSRSTGMTSHVCPYCGANVNINQSAVCEYCGSVLTTDEFDWAVSNIKAIAQRTRQ
ncbi:MAG: Tim44 domain-containing protein [Ruminococcus sp.]|uniref:Tim44 domain-containing protein n=1 Tax=Ruminococcus sp. TaxID=41978 RepID=UPI001B16ACF5|nr:Tim44-like domain-containing protein [Ruminococcus sp.]MBO7474897.1 Tim44 domain-containing protein [Ruminococcus sp.]